MARSQSDFNSASCVALFNKSWARAQIYEVNYAASVDALNDSTTGFTAFKECDPSKHSNASGIRTKCQSGQDHLRARPDPPACHRGRLWRRQRRLWVRRPSAYRHDSASVGLNALWLVSQPVRCHQASAAIVRDILLDVNWP